MQKWFIGCSGFYYPEWKDRFYPQKLAKSKWFEYYTTQFNTLELNNTFYRFPEIKTLDSWYKRSPADFIFSVKAPRSITHYNKFSDSEDLLNEFYNVTSEGLKEKLGCILFQLPPNLHMSDEKLELILKSLNPTFNNVIEFRHESWWNDNVYKALGDKNITFCGMSHPKLPNDIIMNTSTIYYRFHGVPKLYKSEYLEKLLEDFASQIVNSKQAEKIFVYFNNTMDLAAIKNARQLLEIAGNLNNDTV